MGHCRPHAINTVHADTQVHRVRIENIHKDTFVLENVVLKNPKVVGHLIHAQNICRITITDQNYILNTTRTYNS